MIKQYLKDPDLDLDVSIILMEAFSIVGFAITIFKLSYWFLILILPFYVLLFMLVWNIKGTDIAKHKLIDLSAYRYHVDPRHVMIDGGFLFVLDKPNRRIIIKNLATGEQVIE